MQLGSCLESQPVGKVHQLFFQMRNLLPTMPRVIPAALFIVLVPVGLRADSWMPPAPSIHVSEDAGLMVRVEPGGENPDGTNRDRAHCRFYRYSEEKKGYEFWREHDLVNDVRPCDVVIPDDGSFLVTFDDYFGIGTSANTVVVYNSEGRMLKRWALDDIISDAETKELPSSVSSIHWRGDVGMVMDSEHEVCILPPESRSNFDKHRKFKGFILDVKNLTIRERLDKTKEAVAAVDSDQMATLTWMLIAVIEAVILVVAGAAWALSSISKTRRPSSLSG